MQFGTITGRFLATVADTTADTDTDPDLLPITGKVRFTPSMTATVAATEGAIVLPTPITADLDAEGYVSLNGVKGIRLVATNSAGLNPTNFTYAVSFPELRYGSVSVSYRTFNLSLPAGSVVDLSQVAPVEAANGISIVRGEQGERGPVGPQGLQGIAGPAGPKGDTGPAGPASTVAGPKGDTGDTGPQGPKGDTGAAGAASTVAGPQGIQGVKGDTGAQGPKGDTGATGATGPAGGSATSVTASQISDSTATGRSLVTAADAASARNTLLAAAAATTVSPGTGLTGGGDLSANRTLALNAASIASLAKADTALQSAPVTTVAGRTGAVTLTKADVALGNADNTADSNKPVSTPQQTALNLKAPIASPTFTGTVGGITAAMTGAVANDGAILRVLKITQSAYSALATKDANTFYVIVG